MVIIYTDTRSFMVAIGLGKYDGDFQHKMSFSIRMRGVPPTLNVSLYTSPFQFFSGVELELCLLSENANIFVK